MVCDEDATIQVLKSCIEANKMDNSAVQAVLLDVSKKVQTSETTLSALSVLNKLSALSMSGTSSCIGYHGKSKQYAEHAKYDVTIARQRPASDVL